MQYVSCCAEIHSPNACVGPVTFSGNLWTKSNNNLVAFSAGTEGIQLCDCEVGPVVLFTYLFNWSDRPFDNFIQIA